MLILLLILQSLLIAVGAASLVWIIYTILLYRKLDTPSQALGPEANPKIKDKEWFLKVWTEVEKKMLFKREVDYRDALLTAGTLMERLLETLNVYGKDLGAKLSNLHKMAFPNQEALVEAWNLIKEVQSKPDRAITRQEVKVAIDAFEDAFIYLGLYD
jgi:hypothetical protein